VPIPEITVEELALRLDQPGPKPVLLDVRHRHEHNYAALPGSVLVPLPELPERLEDPTDALRSILGKEVVVYCHHGVRSLQGAAVLRAHGIEALSLAGGIDLWSMEIDPKVPRY
jgi:rhodanese-related sulfurtransferase